MHPGTNSREIFDGLYSGFAQAGHEVMRLELGPVWDAHKRNPAASPVLARQFAAQLAASLRDLRIDLVVTMWMNGLNILEHAQGDGRLVTFFERVGVPLVQYWLDAPFWAHGGEPLTWAARGAFDTDFVLGVINNPGTAAEMRRVLRMRHVLALPYGIDADVFHPPEPSPPVEFDVSFALGPGETPPTPAMLAELARDQPDIEAIRRDRAASARESLRGEPDALAAALIERQLADPATPMLDRIEALISQGGQTGASLAAMLQEPARYARITMAVREIDSWRRAFFFCWLAGRFKCARLGGGELPGWPEAMQGTTTGYLPTQRQSVELARARCGLSVMRWQDDVGMHLKPLEIAASGVPCLAHRRPGLEDLLEPDRQVLAFDTLPQAAAWIGRLAAEPGLGERIGAAGLARVRTDHTWAHRAGEIARWAGNVSGKW